MHRIRKRGLFDAGRIVYISTDQIDPNPDQPRRHMEASAMRELSSSVAKYGVLQPLSVRKVDGGRYELISGERRLRAAMGLGLKSVPCIVMDVTTPESAVLILVENLLCRGLDFMEEARGLSRLVNVYGYSQEEAARLVGRSQSSVANKLRLLKLPSDVQYIIRKASLTERHARALLRLGSEEMMLRALETIISEELTVQKTEELIEKLLVPAQLEELESVSGEGSGYSTERVAVPLLHSNTVYRIKDHRMLINSVTRGVDILKKSGVSAELETRQTESELVLTIRVKL